MKVSNEHLEHILNAAHKKICDLESAVDSNTIHTHTHDTTAQGFSIVMDKLKDLGENATDTHNLIGSLVDSMAKMAEELATLKATMVDMSNAMLVVAGKPVEAKAPAPVEPWLLKDYVFDPLLPPPPDEKEYAVMNQGRKIDAIKLYRARTGCGLKEAKDVIESHWTPAMTAAYKKVVGSYDHWKPVAAPQEPAPTGNPFYPGDFPPLIENEIDWINAHDPIKAMKLYRDRTGCGLMVSKNVVTTYQDKLKSKAAWAEAAVQFAPKLAPLNGVEMKFVDAAVGDHYPIDAMKLYRARVGCGLKQAKDAVDAYKAQQKSLFHTQSYSKETIPCNDNVYSDDGYILLPLNGEEINYIKFGQQDLAVALYAKRLGCDSNTAKVVVENYQNGNGPPF